MNNAESNDPKAKQTQQAADSPIKTPGAETAHVKMSDAAKAASGGEAHAGANARSTRNDAPPPVGMVVGPDGRPEGLPRGADVINDDTLDDTVDADGKSYQAKHYDEMMGREPDAVINSNATTVNHVPVQSDGLGGFDSRPGRNGVLLMLEKGYRMIDRGMVAPAIPEVEDRLRLEARDSHGHTLRGRKHYALNHMRPARLIELERS